MRWMVPGWLPFAPHTAANVYAHVFIVARTPTASE